MVASLWNFVHLIFMRSWGFYLAWHFQENSHRRMQVSSSNFFLFLYPESKSSVYMALIALQNRIEIHDSESVDLLKKYILGYGFGVLIWIKKKDSCIWWNNYCDSSCQNIFLINCLIDHFYLEVTRDGLSFTLHFKNLLQILFLIPTGKIGFWRNK